MSLPLFFLRVIVGLCTTSVSINGDFSSRINGEMGNSSSSSLLLSLSDSLEMRQIRPCYSIFRCAKFYDRKYAGFVIPLCLVMKKKVICGGLFSFFLPNKEIPYTHSEIQVDKSDNFPHYKTPSPVDTCFTSLLFVSS